MYILYNSTMLPTAAANPRRRASSQHLGPGPNCYEVRGTNFWAKIPLGFHLCTCFVFTFLNLFYIFPFDLTLHSIYLYIFPKFYPSSFPLRSFRILNYFC